MGRRTALLIAALVVAALGTTGVFLYVNGVDRRAEAGVRVDDVLVATAPIAPGTTAQAAQEAGSMELRPFLHKSLVGLPALSDTTAIAAMTPTIARLVDPSSTMHPPRHRCGPPGPLPRQNGPVAV